MTRPVRILCTAPCAVSRNDQRGCGFQVPFRRRASAILYESHVQLPHSGRRHYERVTVAYGADGAKAEIAGLRQHGIENAAPDTVCTAVSRRKAGGTIAGPRVWYYDLWAATGRRCIMGTAQLRRSASEGSPQ